MKSGEIPVNLGGGIKVYRRYLAVSARALLNRLYPPMCLLCDQRVAVTTGQPGHDLCQPCADDLAGNQQACIRCAIPLPNSVDTVCGGCVNQPPPVVSARVPYLYRPPLSYMISQFKFHGRLAHGRALAGLLADAVSGGLADGRIDRPDALIAVPLHRSRWRQRGFNQAHELALPLARRLQLPLLVRALKRLRPTLAQSDLESARRRSNVRGAFAVGHGALPGHVALVDDVITTGSTVFECAAVLRRAGVQRVDIWALARTPPV